MFLARSRLRQERHSENQRESVARKDTPQQGTRSPRGALTAPPKLARGANMGMQTRQEPRRLHRPNSQGSHAAGKDAHDEGFKRELNYLSGLPPAHHDPFELSLIGLPRGLMETAFYLERFPDTPKKSIRSRRPRRPRESRVFQTREMPGAPWSAS